MAKPVFKSDLQHQPALFPFDFDTMIPAQHPVRLVNMIVDKLDITEILSSYKGGGTSSYHPRTLLKIVLYAYLTNVYSSRKIERATKENIYYIWLSGYNFPDHNTINNFRSSKLKGKIDQIFTQVVMLLNESGLVALKQVFTDGTKLESAANRYSFVWKKSVEKHKDRLEKKIKVILKEIEDAIREDQSNNEELLPGSTLSAAELDQKIEELNQQLSQKPAPKEAIKQVKKLKKEHLPKLAEYERNLSILGNRNSFSKTDHDATFMVLKEDQLKNRLLKPAYNLQISTENNFITNYSLHQQANDINTFIPHLLQYNQQYGHFPQQAVADAGYGSLENYLFLDQQNIESYVKYNWFHKEQSDRFKNDISQVENLYYNAQDDYFVCPMGQRMYPIENQHKKTSNAFEYEVTIYGAVNCSGCPLRGACHKKEGNRKIEVNKQLIYYKQQARSNLLSDTGKVLSKRRGTEVEQTFGQIKWNKGFKRLKLKGIPKVSIEIGLIAIVHNLQKLAVALSGGTLPGLFKGNGAVLCRLGLQMNDLLSIKSIKRKLAPFIRNFEPMLLESFLAA